MTNSPIRNVRLTHAPVKAGSGQHGTKYRLDWTDENGKEGHANTKGGTLITTLMALYAGDRVNLMRDGRGSIIGIGLIKESN